MKVLIVFYSRYGNTARLAEAIAEGARSVLGTEVLLRRVAETAPATVIDRDERWHKTHQELQKYPEATPTDLEQADAIVFGSPTRYGNMSAELKLFIDKTGPQWVTGKLVGKVGAVFCTNSTLHSGNESTLLSMMIPLFHHGMIIVGVPQTVPETGGAGSYYGASATTGGGADRTPTKGDLTVARAQGRRVAEVAMQLLRGREGQRELIWVNVDHPTAKCVIHKDGCLSFKGTHETPWKGVGELRSDGGWLSFTPVDVAESYCRTEWEPKGYTVRRGRCCFK